MLSRPLGTGGRVKASSRAPTVFRHRIVKQFGFIGLFIGAVVISLSLRAAQKREGTGSVKELKNVALTTAAEQHGDSHDRVL